MKNARNLVFMALACAACGQDPAPQAPVEVRVMQAPALHVGAPAQLLLDVRTGIPTAGVEITIEGDAGLTVVDYAPRVLPATDPKAGGHQVFVDVLPTSAGTVLLTARLVLHIGGERTTRLVTLPLLVSGPETVLPAPNEPIEDVAPDQ